MRKIIISSGLTVGTLAPFIANAQNVQGVLNTVGSIVNILVILCIGGAILAFFWGLIKYIAGGTEMKADGMKMMIYGIVSLFVMVSIWGLIRLLGNTFLPGVSNSPIPAPYQYNPGA